MLFSGIGFLVGLALLVYLGTSLVPRALVTLTKAGSAQKVSIKNSILIGQKIMADADGEEKCVVNVFVLDSEGKGIKGKTVELSGIGIYQKITDSMGQATFEVTSTVAGQYNLMAMVDGAYLPKSLTVTFK